MIFFGSSYFSSNPQALVKIKSTMVTVKYSSAGLSLDAKGAEESKRKSHLGRESRQDSGAVGKFHGYETYMNEYSSLKRSPEVSSGTHYCAGSLRASNHRVTRKVVSRAAFYLRQEVVQKYSRLSHR